MWLFVVACVVGIATGLFFAKRKKKEKQPVDLWDKKFLYGNDKEFVQLSPNCWQITGKLSYPLPRNMVVIQYEEDGEKKLIIHSAIALDEEEMEKLESLGSPTIMIVPNCYHRLDCNRYKQRYPSIKVICPKEAVEEIEKVIPVDGTCEEEFLFNEMIEIVEIEGLKKYFELVYLVKNDENDDLVSLHTDLLFNQKMPKDFFGKLFGHYIFGSVGYFGISRLGRWFTVRSKTQVADFLACNLGNRGITCISMCHGNYIKGDTTYIKERFVEAATRLLEA
eukprot:TRINITY_DN776084_c0_g1_i1.p1 TRINITY_DN776084_c0_g1~~TRINITY_DN776084_c0_g1_i1.p1  ORF type:complete len:279 (-),score=92.25 TRINITY_DN776084_c0_g1_i1:196-1032(-)